MIPEARIRKIFLNDHPPPKRMIYWQSHKYITARIINPTITEFLINLRV